MREVVFPNQGFADNIGVCEGCGGMGEDVVEVEGFVGGDLEEGRCWCWKLRNCGYGLPAG